MSAPPSRAALNAILDRCRDATNDETIEIPGAVARALAEVVIGEMRKLRASSAEPPTTPPDRAEPTAEEGLAHIAAARPLARKAIRDHVGDGSARRRWRRRRSPRPLADPRRATDRSRHAAEVAELRAVLAEAQGRATSFSVRLSLESEKELRREAQFWRNETHQAQLDGDAARAEVERLRADLAEERGELKPRGPRCPAVCPSKKPGLGSAGCVLDPGHEGPHDAGLWVGGHTWHELDHEAQWVEPPTFLAPASPSR